MRLKRGKRYRKLLGQYSLSFGFREPWQVIVDDEVVKEAANMKIDLQERIEITLQGKIKLMITQCDMRRLYATKQPGLIDQAKAFERRRCGHHLAETPLSTLDCLSEVVGPTNKNRYIIASQDPEVRAVFRSIPGVPLLYFNRSVLLLEPMARSSENVRDKEEMNKLKAGIKGRRGASTVQKRKREEEDEGERSDNLDQAMEQTGDARSVKKKRTKGPKGPNPLSIRKPKSRPAQQPQAKALSAALYKKEDSDGRISNGVTSVPSQSEEPTKCKRKRKHKSHSDEGAAASAVEAIDAS